MILGPTLASSIPTIGYAIFVTNNGKPAIPVAPSSYIYSHFEHVSGVPAPEGGQGVAINKLKILDVLIDQLIQMKETPKPAVEYGDFITDDQIDALILQYDKQLQAAKATSKAGPYQALPSVPSGTIVDLLA